MYRKKSAKKISKHGFKRWGTAILLAGILTGTALLTSGCKVPVVSTVISSGETVFKIGSEKCSEKEARIILLNYQKDYSSLYGVDMWAHDYSQGESLEDYVKNLTVSQLAEVYTLDIIAKEQELSLSEEELDETEAAAKEYLEGMSEKELEYLGVKERDVQGLYERYLLAKKLYSAVTEEVPHEVSDDEAHVMIMKQICVSDGTMAEEIHTQLEGGTDFDSLSSSYNEADATDLYVTKTTFDSDVTKELMALETGAYSDVIAIEDSYYIFYCVNAFDEELTQMNKEKVLSQRMEDAVNSTYSSYTDQLESQLNENVWDEVTVDTSLELKGASFLEVYEAHFECFQ